MGVKFNPFTSKLDIVDSPDGDFDSIDVSGDITLDDGGTYTTTVQAVTATQDRTISFPDATGTVALVNGANGTIQYNDAGTLKGNSDFTVDPDWNNASTVFTGLKLNVTDTASAAGSNLVDIQSNGTSDVVIDSSGNVGIGTTSPNNLLTLNSNTANTSVTIQSSDTGAAAIVFGGQSDFSRGRVVYNNSTDSLAFETNNLNEAFRITSDGKLGLGTASPGYAAHISAAKNTSQLFLGITGLSSADDYAQIGFGSGSTPYGLVRLGFDNPAGVTNTYLSFHNNNGTSNVERLRIDSSGNLGIATSTPGDKLEIGGAGAGIILASPDGTRYRLTVANGGTLSIAAV